MQRSDSGRELLLRVSRLADEIVAIDFHVREEPGALSLAATSVPRVFDLAGLAVTLLDQVQDHYDDGVGHDPEGERDHAADATAVPDSLDGIGALISTTIAAHEVRDLAFVAAGQIRSCLTRLQAAFRSQRLLNMVAGADDALARLRKGLIPVESAICEYEGQEPPDRPCIDLEIMLETRRLYGQLRRELLAVGEPDTAELVAHLTEAGERLARLRGSQIFTYLRLNDRVHVRSLQRRIVTWLGEGPVRDNQVGQVIWGELCTFANLIIQINKRQELQEHDRQVITASYHALYANVSPPKVIPADILERLRSLQGLDDELDSLILTATSRDPKDWKAPIRRLWKRSDRTESQSSLQEPTEASSRENRATD